VDNQDTPVAAQCCGPFLSAAAPNLATMVTRTATRAQLRCSACGLRVAKWAGRCPECQQWGSISESAPPAVAEISLVRPVEPARSLLDTGAEGARARASGIGELDRVLGGGLVDGAVVLLAGEPGIGKSTLLLSVAAALGRPGAPTLVVSGEESTAQVRVRAERTGAVGPDVFLAAENDLGAVLSHVEAVGPSLLVVDSVQTMARADVEGGAGSVTQVRECAGALIRLAKSRGLPVVLVGHVTKDGGIAGPRVLEHLVDVVLTIEGDRHGPLRLLRAVKNRYGPTDEVGCFVLGESGLRELADPSGLFLSAARDAEPVPGTCVTVTLEGRRPLVAEVQALVVPVPGPTPRRAVSGLDSARSAMLLAVLTRRAGLALSQAEVYLATVGGVRLAEPAADLAAALAVASAAADRALPARLVAVGEVGLAGEVRPVPGVARRLAEAARLGFRHALVPVGSDVGRTGEVEVTEVADLAAALRAVGGLAVGGQPVGGQAGAVAAAARSVPQRLGGPIG
jgi:DNA repair protein RadA/Sms